MSPTIVRMKIASSQISTVWLTLAPGRCSRLVVRVEFSRSAVRLQQCVSDDSGDVEQNHDFASDPKDPARNPLFASRFVRRTDFRPQNSLDIAKLIYN